MYFLHSERARAVKIGFTAALGRDRLTAVRATVVGSVRLVLTLPRATYHDEQRLHFILRRHRVLGGGIEWFEQDPLLSWALACAGGSKTVEDHAAFLAALEAKEHAATWSTRPT